MWLQESSSPTGDAKERRQSERSVESFSYRVSVATVPGRSSASDRVCRHRRLSPMRISRAERSMSCNVASPSGMSEK